MDDFVIRTGEWEKTIVEIEKAKKDIEESSADIKDIVAKSLGEGGISGPLADHLVNKFDEQVMKSFRDLGDFVEQQITTNKDNLESYNNLQESAIRKIDD